MAIQRAEATEPQNLSLTTPAWSALPLRFLGMGFYLAWIYSVQFGSPASPTPMDVAVTESLSLLSNIANAATLILCAIFARQLTPLTQRQSIAWGAGAAMALGTLLLGLTGATPLVTSEPVAASLGALNAVGSVVGAIISGLGLGIVILLWGEFYASLPLRLVMIYYSASFIVATLLNFLILVLGGIPALVVTALLPVISVGCCEGSTRLRSQQAHTEEVPEDDRLSQKTARLAAAARSEATAQARRVADTRWTFPLRPVLLMAAYSFTFSYCRASGGVVNALPMLGVALIAAFTLVGSLWFFDRFRIELLYRLALPLMVAGVLLQPFGGEIGLATAGIFLNAGHAGFMILVMILFSTMCYRYGIVALWLFGITRAARVVAIVIGSYFGMTVSAHWTPEVLAFTTTLIVVALVALSTLLITDKDMENTWGMNPIINKASEDSKAEEGPQSVASSNAKDAQNDVPNSQLRSEGTSPTSAGDERGNETKSKVGLGKACFEDVDSAHESLTSSQPASSQTTSPASSASTTATAASGNYFDTFVGRCAQIARIHGLTPREEEVLALLAQGYSVPRIEKELFISNGTAKGHVRHIYAKMGVHTRDELIEAVDMRDRV